MLPYFIVAIQGHRLGRKPWLRILTGLWLALPFLASGAALLFSERPVIIGFAGPLLCFTCILFAAFVFPGMRKSSRRPMRPRDYGSDGSDDTDPDYASSKH